MQKFNGIDAPFASFEFGNEALRFLEMFCHVRLSQASLDFCCPQFS